MNLICLDFQNNLMMYFSMSLHLARVILNWSNLLMQKSSKILFILMLHFIFGFRRFNFRKTSKDTLKGLHRCWWRMLETKCVGDKSRHQYRELSTNIKYQSPTPNSGILCWFFVTNILKWSPSLSHQHNDVTNTTVTLDGVQSPKFCFFNG